MLKKFTLSDFNLKTEGLPAEQKAFMENIGNTMVTIVNKALEGALSEEEVKEQFKSVNDQLKAVDGDKFAQLIKDNQDLCEQVKNLSETLDKLQKKGVSVQTLSKFDDKLTEMFESEKFNDYLTGATKKSGAFEGFSLKDVSMTENYAGTALITDQQSTVVSQVANKKIHMRDIVNTIQGDPEFPVLSFAQVYDFDRNAGQVSENGSLPESSLKIKEENATVARIGTHMKVSKRMLKSRVYIRSFILNTLPEAVRNEEDWAILFGDGDGDNIKGVTKYAGCLPVEEIIGSSVVKGVAGDIKAITGYNGDADTIIEFKDPQDLILDGMTITCTGAAVITALNSAQQLIKISDRKILLKGVAFTTETGVAKMTFVVNYAGFKSISSPNSEDVIKTAFAVMHLGQYSPTAIALNPITINAIESEKDTTGRNLGIVKTINGAKSVAGYPVLEYPGVPVGKYVIGDFSRGANLVDYSSLTLEWADDVDTKLKNQTVLIAQEEVIFPVYMPWAFSYGDLTSLKTAITK